jgi:hypothetical protein
LVERAIFGTRQLRECQWDPQLTVNSETAVAKSEYLLQLARGNSLTLLCLPSNFDWLAKRRKVIFTREIFSAALAVVIAGAMFV